MLADLRGALAAFADSDPDSAAAGLLVWLDASQIPTSRCPGCGHPLDVGDGRLCHGCDALLHDDPDPGVWL